MNKVILGGNLTRDPEVRYSQSENPMAIARFGIAINRRFKRQGETDCDFFNCTAFGKTAEFVEKYFRKGTRIILSGRIENNNYTNENGEKVYSVQVLVEEVEFGEKKTSDSQSVVNGANNNSNNDDFMNIPDGVEDGLPFN